MGFAMTPVQLITFHERRFFGLVYPSSVLMALRSDGFGCKSYTIGTAPELSRVCVCVCVCVCVVSVKLSGALWTDGVFSDTLTAFLCSFSRSTNLSSTYWSGWLRRILLLITLLWLITFFACLAVWLAIRLPHCVRQSPDSSFFIFFYMVL